MNFTCRKGRQVIDKETHTQLVSTNRPSLPKAPKGNEIHTLGFSKRGLWGTWLCPGTIRHQFIFQGSHLRASLSISACVLWVLADNTHPAKNSVMRGFPSKSTIMRLWDQKAGTHHILYCHSILHNALRAWILDPDHPAWKPLPQTPEERAWTSYSTTLVHDLFNL